MRTKSSHTTRAANREMSGSSLEIRNDHDALDLRNSLGDLAHALEAVDVLPGVAIAVGAEQNARLNLPNRSSTPLTPKSGEHDDQIAPRLVAASIAITVSGMFGINPATRSPDPDAHAAQRRRDARDLAVQLGDRSAALRAALVPEDDRFAIVAIPKEILGEIEARADEPVRSELGIRRRDAVASNEYTLTRDLRICVGDDTAEPPDLGPEQFQVADRPLVQRREVCDERLSDRRASGPAR